MSDQTRDPGRNSALPDTQALGDQQMPQASGRWPEGTQATDAGPPRSVREGDDAGTVGAPLQGSDKEVPIDTASRA